jgi:hypothetical protein
MRFYEDDQLKLFDLAKDLKEQTDLSKKMPEEVARLNKLLTEYLTAVNAQLPKPNPDFDPKKPLPPPKKGKDKTDTDEN